MRGCPLHVRARDTWKRQLVNFIAFVILATALPASMAGAVADRPTLKSNETVCFLPSVLGDYRGPDRLAYSLDEHIYVGYGPDYEPVRLTASTAYDREPTWSPDGQYIAFWTSRSGATDIYTMRADGTDLRRLTDSPGWDVRPIWSPDGNMICYQGMLRVGDFNSYAVWVMQKDGSDKRCLTEPDAEGLYPQWSPDGASIAYATNHDLNWEIYVSTCDGTIHDNLTNHSGDDQWPSWSPHGGRIAFQSYRDGDYEIYIMNSDGSGQTNITNAPDSAEVAPSWSPDGKWVAFRSNRDGVNYIYLWSTETGTTHRLTSCSTNSWLDARILYSADGSQLLFGSAASGGGCDKYGIYSVMTDGSHLRLVAPGVLQGYGLDWWP